MSCCPPSSWPALKPPEDYKPKGIITKVSLKDIEGQGDDADDDTQMNVYSVGNKNSKYCIYFNYDIFGLDGGRTKAMADTLADVCDCECIIIDVYLGDAALSDGSNIMDFVPKYSSSVVLPRYLHILKKETRHICFVGTCWGAYASTFLTAKHICPTAFASVWWHPSTRAAGFYGQDEMEITSKIVVPTSILAAEVDDPEQYHPGGASIISLEKTAPGSECLPLAKGMNHGWTVRGDISLPNVKEQVESAVENFKRFFDVCKEKIEK